MLPCCVSQNSFKLSCRIFGVHRARGSLCKRRPELLWGMCRKVVSMGTNVVECCALSHSLGCGANVVAIVKLSLITRLIVRLTVILNCFTRVQKFLLSKEFWLRSGQKWPPFPFRGSGLGSPVGCHPTRRMQFSLP